MTKPKASDRRTSKEEFRLQVGTTFHDKTGIGFSLRDERIRDKRSRNNESQL